MPAPSSSPAPAPPRADPVPCPVQPATGQVNAGGKGERLPARLPGLRNCMIAWWRGRIQYFKVSLSITIVLSIRANSTLRDIHRLLPGTKGFRVWPGARGLPPRQVPPAPLLTWVAMFCCNTAAPRCTTRCTTRTSTYEYNMFGRAPAQVELSPVELSGRQLNIHHAQHRQLNIFAGNEIEHKVSSVKGSCVYN